VASASNHDRSGQPDDRDEQEKANHYQCLIDPTHRCAPVYTLARVLKRIRNAKCKSANVQSLNVGFLISPLN
jgi:hypothetical protein